MIELLSPNDCESILEYVASHSLYKESPIFGSLDLMTLRNMMFYNQLILVGEKTADTSLINLFVISVPGVESLIKSCTVVYYSPDYVFISQALDMIREVLGSDYSKIKVKLYNHADSQLLVDSGFISEVNHDSDNGSMAIYSYFF
jgi:hypothetical protein